MYLSDSDLTAYDVAPCDISLVTGKRSGFGSSIRKDGNASPTGQPPGCNKGALYG